MLKCHLSGLYIALKPYQSWLAEALVSKAGFNSSFASKDEIAILEIMPKYPRVTNCTNKVIPIPFFD
jgi:hypothetical protein